MTWPETYIATMAAVIRRYGHAVQYMLADRETGTPPYAYTVGLHATSRDGHELAISGLPPKLSVGLLNDLAALLVGGDIVPSHGLEIGGLLEEGLTLRLREAERPGEMKILGAFYDTNPLVWQAMWPDEHGNFPGDPSYTLPGSAQALL